MLLVESGITDILIEPSATVLQTDREDWEPGTDRADDRQCARGRMQLQQPVDGSERGGARDAD